MGVINAPMMDPIPKLAEETESFILVPVTAAAFAHGGYAVFPVTECSENTCGMDILAVPAAAHGNCVHENVSMEPDVPAPSNGPKATVGVIPTGEYLHSSIKHFTVVGCFDIYDPESVREPGKKPRTKAEVVLRSEISHLANSCLTFCL